MAQALTLSGTRKGKPSKGRPTKEISDERDVRNALIGAGVTLFAQRGFKTVGVKEVAESVDLTAGLIRHYFGSKQDFIQACNDRVTDSLTKVFKEIIESSRNENIGLFLEGMTEATIRALSDKIELLYYFKFLTIENPADANVVAQEYFNALQQELNLLEAKGLLRESINKVWLTFFLMILQMGPVFLADQIKSLVGVDAHDPLAIQQRNLENLNILKYGILGSAKDVNDSA